MTGADIVALISAAGTLSGCVRPVAYQTLIGLLAATGMRISEALALNDEHVDPSSTYWYLIASPELAGVIASRLDNIDLDVNP